MTRTAGRPDPRPRLFAALDQAQRQVDGVGSADLSRPTPCAEYEVRTLLAHLVAVLRKLAVVGQGGDMAQVTDPADDLGDDCAAMFHRARADFHRVWAPGSTLSTSYALPWGRMTGSELLDAYAHEFTVHAWDLSRVTGRVSELDPMLAKAALDWYARNVPAHDRPEGGPFAPPVAVAKDADAYTRLAGFLGRPV
jgi:uncharacterized protein (TIGR03086 family)